MKNSHIIKRGKIYYFHFRIPKSMKSVYRKDFMRKSLNTYNLKIAEQRVNSLMEFISLIFKKAESNMLSEVQVDSLVSEYIDKITDKHNEATTLVALPQHDWNEQSSGIILERYQQFLADSKDNLRMNDFTSAIDFLDWVKEEKNISVNEELDRIKLCRTFIQRMAKHIESLFSPLISGDYTKVYDSPININGYATPIKKYQIEQEDPVGELFELFYKKNSTSGVWRKNTITDKRAHIDLFLEYFGKSTPVQEINLQHMLEYREDVLKRLPKRRKLNKVIRDLPLEKQLANTSEPKISIKTINQYLGTVQSFLDWCIEQEIITRNPAVKLQLQETKSFDEKREIYTEAELLKIVKGLSELKINGKNGIKNLDRIWITLLGIFQGMRENEICQLFIDDIININGIACISSKASAAKQTAKNRTSIRTIPIHKDLISLGFLDFVNNRRTDRDKLLRSRKASKDDKERQEQLFITMTYNANRGNFIKNFLNFYSKFNKDITTSSKRTFHSLRHNFITKLNNSSKVSYAVSYLAGHKFTTQTAKTYTKPDFEILQQELSRLQYDFDIFKTFGVLPFPEEAITEQIKKLPVKE